VTTSGDRSSTLLPEDVRRLNRVNSFERNTSGLCPDFVQANLVVLPASDAFDFLRFCQQNPAPCPVIEVTGRGQFEAKMAAPGSDLRTDVARYQVYREGHLVEERQDIRDVVDDDMVCFLLGCSYSFEHLLVKARVPIRHHEQGVAGAPMYITSRDCVPAGKFAGKLVVTMRPIPGRLISKVMAITAAHPESHGAPVSVGDSQSLGIRDLDRPDWGDPVVLQPGDVPVFWACGVTSQQIASDAKIDYMITHTSGYMFVTDIRIDG
jgi:uncharacterized protein YcsI (UPF0317 family)